MDQNELIRLTQQFTLTSDKDPLSKNIALKIRSQLPEEAREAFDILSKHNIVDATSWYGNEIDIDDKVSLIQKAILLKHKISADYTSGSGAYNNRVLRPVGVVLKANYYYVVAYCELREDYRTFSLSKMSNIIILEAHFEDDPSFNLKAYWDKAVTGYIRRVPEVSETATGDKILYPVEVRISNSMFYKLKGFSIVEISEEGSLTFDGISEDIAYALIFPQADEILVIKPDSLRRKIFEKCQKIISVYQ